VAAMLQEVLRLVPIREREKYLDRYPETIVLIMTEADFQIHCATTRLRQVLDTAERSEYRVLVVRSWLRPIEESR
jgi:hypothetical protein